MNYSTMQALVDHAYESYSDDKSYADFLFFLPTFERMAVLIDNLNGQVCNGGFRQWIDNGYVSHAADVRYVLDKIGTHAAYLTTNLVLIASRADENADLDSQDTAYYRICDQLMDDAEAFFSSAAVAA